MVSSENGNQVVNNRGETSSNITLTAPHKITDSDSSEEEREGTGHIRVGREYQAVLPAYTPSSERMADYSAEKALLVWSPSAEEDAKLNKFIHMAKDKYRYTREQALAMLFWHKHDMDKALQDLANFTPFPDEWSVEDKLLFEQAFKIQGKDFKRIQQMLPEKSIASLVKHYYGRTRNSLVDMQARKLPVMIEEEYPEHGSGRKKEVTEHAGSTSGQTNPRKEEAVWQKVTSLSQEHISTSLRTDSPSRRLSSFSHRPTLTGRGNTAGIGQGETQVHAAAGPGQ